MPEPAPVMAATRPSKRSGVAAAPSGDVDESDIAEPPGTGLENSMDSSVTSERRSAR